MISSKVSEWKYYEISGHYEYELHPLYFHFTGKAMRFPSDFQLAPRAPRYAQHRLHRRRRCGAPRGDAGGAAGGGALRGTLQRLGGWGAGTGRGKWAGGPQKMGKNHGKNVKTRENLRKWWRTSRFKGICHHFFTIMGQKRGFHRWMMDHGVMTGNHGDFVRFIMNDRDVPQWKRWICVAFLLQLWFQQRKCGYHQWSNLI